MQTILANLNKTAGVIGSALFDHTNHCVSSLLPAPYEPILLVNVLEGVLTISDMVSSLDQGAGIEAFSVEFDAGWLLVRVLDTLTVVVLAYDDANMAILNVAFNVATLKLSRAISQAAIYPPPGNSSSAPFRDSLGHSGPPVDPAPWGAPFSRPQSSAAIRPPDDSTAPVAESGESPGPAGNPRTSDGVDWFDEPVPVGAFSSPAPNAGSRFENFATDSGEWSLELAKPAVPGRSAAFSMPVDSPDKAVRGAAGVKVIRHIAMVLSRYVGAAAKNVVLEEVERLGADMRTIRTSQLNTLIRNISRRIKNRRMRSKFVNEANGETRR